MIQLIGLNSKSDISIREKLAISFDVKESIVDEILKKYSEVVILSTCNRIEIYFNGNTENNNAIEDFFTIFKWDMKYKENIFYLKGIDVSKHLLEVVSGFHSKILGEDQILGQVKDAYSTALELNAVNGEIQKLFQIAITCGKEFKYKTQLYKVPVSAASIAVNECKKLKVRKVLVLGYGEVGKLVVKYLIGSQVENIIIAVRNEKAVTIENKKIQVINFNDRKNYYQLSECIISCTSAKEIVIKQEEISNKEQVIFDLAIPRDVEESISSMDNKILYDIDKLSFMDIENKEKRKQIMHENKFIIDKYIEEYNNWHKINSLIPSFKKIKEKSERICEARYSTFRNKRKTKNNEELVKTLLKSTSNAYVNRAIEVLKEEQLKGRADECLRILEKIFY